LIHKYLKLSNFKKLKIGLFSIFSETAYKHETEELIKTYAIKTRDDLETYINAKKDLLQISSIAKEAENKKNSLETAQGNVTQTNIQYSNILQAKNQEIDQVRVETERINSKLLEEKRAEEERIKAATDAKRILEEKLKEHLVDSGVVNLSSNGSISGFNEAIIMKKLEDIMLGDVLSDLSKEGNSGFLSKVQSTYPKSNMTALIIWPGQ